MNTSAHILEGGGGDGYSPIQQLPPELLCDIFHHCISHPTRRSGFFRLPYPSVTEAPLKLGRICRSWRQLVLSTPTLWSRLSLGAGRSRKGRNPLFHLVILDEWLARSQLAPLRLAIRFTIRSNDDGVGPSDINTVIAKVISHSNRLEYLDLHLPSQRNGPIFAQLCEAATNLKVLHILTPGGDPIEVNLSNQASLNQLSLTAPVQFASNHGSMRNIRSIRMEFPALNGYFQCLDLCPSVEDVQFVFPKTIDFRPSISEPMRILPSIITLSLTSASVFEYEESFDFGLFMDRFQLPRLRELDIHSSLWTDDVPSWSHASALLKRSNAHLESFTVMNMLHGSDFRECLRQSPSLKMLSLGSHLIAKVTIDTLMRRSIARQPFACPQLQHVELCGFSPRAYRKIAELVLRRWHSDPSLPIPSRIRRVVLRVSNEDQVKPFLHLPGIDLCILDGLLVIWQDDDFHCTVYPYDHSIFLPPERGNLSHNYSTRDKRRHDVVLGR